MEDMNVKKSEEEVVSILDRPFDELSVRMIKNYNYAPSLYFHKIGEEDELFMGMEIEVDKGGENDRKAKIAYDILGDNNCYIVSDGSLDNGFEIVTHPCTIEYHKSLPYEELFKTLESEGFKESPTTGLHVHINRNFFGDNDNDIDLNICKILYLVNAHWEFIRVLSRRKDLRYTKKIESSDSSIKLYSNSINIGKYSCVNLMHKQTIEFRMFSGTLKYFNLVSTLEFIRNLAYVCKQTSFEDIKKLSFQDIIQYKSTEYLELYCKNRKIQF